MSFDGLHTDAQDIFAWAAEQPYVDSEKLFLSGQSMGGYIAASCAPVIQPHGLILLCPGAGMWFGCAQRADGVVQTGRDYTDMEGLCYKMAFRCYVCMGDSVGTIDLVMKYLGKDFLSACRWLAEEHQVQLEEDILLQYRQKTNACLNLLEMHQNDKRYRL